MKKVIANKVYEFQSLIEDNASYIDFNPYLELGINPL